MSGQHTPARRYTRLQIQQLLSGNREEEKRFMRFCGAMGRHQAFQHGVLGYVDDVRQDLAESLLCGAARSFANGEIESDQFVFAAINAARNISQRYQRVEKRQRTKERRESADHAGFHLDDLPGNVLDHDSNPELCMIHAEETRDRASAMEQVRQRIRDVPTPTLIRKPATKNTTTNTVEDLAAREAAISTLYDPPTLNDLLEKLGWSHDDLADRIDIQRWGRFDDLKYAARNTPIYRKAVAAIPKGAAYKQTLEEILAVWASRLGFDRGDYVSLADGIDVNVTTVYRWVTGRALPTGKGLARKSRATHEAVLKRSNTP